MSFIRHPIVSRLQGAAFELLPSPVCFCTERNHGVWLKKKITGFKCTRAQWHRTKWSHIERLEILPLGPLVCGIIPLEWEIPWNWKPLNGLREHYNLFCLFISTSVALQQEITRGVFTAASANEPTNQPANRAGTQPERTEKWQTTFLHYDPFLTPFILQISYVLCRIFLALGDLAKWYIRRIAPFFRGFFFPPLSLYLSLFLDFWAITDEEAVLKCH